MNFISASKAIDSLTIKIKTIIKGMLTKPLRQNSLGALYKESGILLARGHCLHTNGS